MTAEAILLWYVLPAVLAAIAISLKHNAVGDKFILRDVILTMTPGMNILVVAVLFLDWFFESMSEIR